MEPMVVAEFAVPSALRFVFGVVAKMNQRVVPLRRFHDYVASAAAVAARGATTGHKLLPAESHAAVAAVAGFHADSCFIDKHA